MEIDQKEENLKVKNTKNNKEENITQNDNNDNIENKEIEQKEKKGKKIYIVIIMGIILLLLVLMSTIFALLNVSNTKILSKISVQGIDISELERDEAIQAIETAIEENMKLPILIKYQEFETTVTAEQIEAEFNIEETIEKAYEIGRKSNIVSNNYEILKTKLFGEEIELAIKYNEEELEKILIDISTKIPDTVIESSYYIEEKNLIITQGKPGLIIDKEKLKNDIIENIKLQNIGKQYIEISAKIGNPSEIDIEKIHQEIYKEPKDAYYTTEPFNIYAEIEGVDFAITIEQAKELLKEEKDEYIIPLKITQPEKTVYQIGIEAFPHVLSTFTTKYDESNRNRSTNIRLVTEKINETVLMPGEVFSYNTIVGERTASAGYKEASVYSGGQIVNGIGGGICQVSSTLYNSVLLANLEVVDRINHCFLPSYVKAGRDATVSYGTIDFKFKNNRKYPIKIICTAQNGISAVTIQGIKEEVEYEVVIESKITSTIPKTTQYVEDNTLASGQEKVIQAGFNGFRSETYKTLKYNGAVVSTTLISKDTYNAMQRIVARGTYVETIPPVQEETTPEHEQLEQNVIPDTPEIPEASENTVQPEETI